MNAPNQKDDFELDLRHLLLLIRRNILLFIVIGLLGLLGGGIYALTQKKKYESRLTFALDEGSSQASGLSAIASQFGFGGNIGDNGLFSGDNILEVMKSKRIFDAVMLSSDTFNNGSQMLIDRFLETSGMKKKMKMNDQVIFPIDSTRKQLSFFQDSLLNEIYQDWKRNYLNAYKPDRKFSIYEVNITLPDQKLAKVATERVIEKTMAFYTEIKTAKSKSILKTLEERVASMKGNFTSSLENMAYSKDANLNPAFVQATVPIMKEQTNVQVYTAAYSELFKNLEIARFQYMKETPLLQIIDSPQYPLKVVRLSLAKGMLIGGAAATILLYLLLLVREFYRKKDTKTAI